MTRRYWTGMKAVNAAWLAGLLAMGCGGGGGPTGANGDYYMRFDIPGKHVSITAQASLLAAFAQASNQRNMLATGFDGNTNFSLTVFDGVPITEKTYTGYDVVQSVGALVGVLLTYQDGTGAVYSSGNLNGSQTVRITQLTATTVKGNFSGTLKAAGHADLQVSGGEFFVARAN